VRLNKDTTHLLIVEREIYMQLIVLLLLLLLLIIIIIIDVSCHRPILPGNSPEPTVIPTAQASSFTLQYFPYCV
jgi:hypothetical protein